MTTTDIVNLALNIGLGVVSLILSIFAIWLSLRFNDSSNAALDSVKELTREVKTMVQIGLSQQNDFSTKMLDSIIEQNRFGRPDLGGAQSSSNLEVLVRKSLENAEKNITLSVENKVREIIRSGINDPRTIEAGINEIRSNIQEFSGLIKEQSNVVEALRSFRDYPAHYVLLAAIIKSGARSEQDIEKVAEEYKVPSGWDMGGISNLIEKGLIQGTDSEFDITPENHKFLTDWVNANWKIITHLQKSYANKLDEGVTEEEKEIAKSLKF